MTAGRHVEIDFPKCSTEVQPRVRDNYRRITPRPGFTAAFADRYYERDCDFEQVGADVLKFHFKLSGESAVSYEGQPRIPVDVGRTSILVQPQGSSKREFVHSRSHERYVNLTCTSGFLATVFCPLPAHPPEPIRQFLLGRPSDFSFQSVMMPPQTRGLVETALDLDKNFYPQDIMLEARALELLCHVVNQLTRIETPSSPIRERDRRRITELCEELDETGGLSRTIHDLCRQLAWNETQMMACFKEVTGVSISQYCLRVRMEKAHRQLRDTDSSITEVAFDAGYEHPSNFSTAFKRTFGYSPRDVRNF